MSEWKYLSEEWPPYGQYCLFKDYQKRPYIGVLFGDSDDQVYTFPHTEHCKTAEMWREIPEDED